jgi:hypothetical protein
MLLDLSRFFGLVELERDVNGEAKTLLKLIRNY